VEQQEIPCPDWADLGTTLELGGQPLEAYSNAFSPAADVTAPTIALGTFAELQAADLTGRIPIFYGALAQHELAAKGAIYVSPRDRAIIEILEARAPAALLTINPSLHAHWRLVEDYDLNLPSATVSARAGLALVARAGETVRLRIAARRTPSHTANLVARRPGPRPERIVVCAHYDSKVDTPGAYDNAAGVAVLLTLAQAITPTTHTLEFVAFTGEEGYGLGDMEYARRAGDGFGQIVAALNIDGPGPWLAANTLATFAASEPFAAMAAATAGRYPGVALVDPWPASDHYIFYSHGVPSLAISSLGIKDQYHTPFDSLEWISPAKLAEATRLALDLVTAVDAHDLAWGRPA
jgi:Iap family predicted aminopeptidase